MIKQRNITLIVVHCTASKCTSNLTPEALDALHKRQGFTECGYHYYITKDGTIHHMRDITHVGAHAKGYNTPSIGIAYEGGLDASGRAADTRTTAQKQSLEILLRFLLLSYPAAKICGHRDLSPDHLSFLPCQLSPPLRRTIKKEVIMKPFWRTTLKVLKVIGKIFVWLTGADSPVKDDEKRND